MRRAKLSMTFILIAAAILTAGSVLAGEPPVGELGFIIKGLAGANQLKILDAYNGNEKTISYDLDGWTNGLTWSEEGDYVAYIGRNGDIWRANASGSAIYDYFNITEGSIYGYYPAWSPDGRYFALTDGDQIYRLSSGGTGPIQLTFWTPDPDSSMYANYPSWSPDSSSIVYSIPEWEGEIYTMDLNGNDEEFITDGNEPDWSPDGHRIAYTYEQDIYIFDLRTGDSVNITPDPDNDRTEYNGFNRRPKWSPDSRHIAFISDRDHLLEVELHYLRTEELYIMRDDGSEVTRLTYGTWYIEEIAWRPMDIEVSVEEQTPRPSKPTLGMNRPNPFNPRTIIPFDLPADGHVKLTVHDILGRTVAVLNDRPMKAGRHEIAWDAGDMASGVYFARMEAGAYSLVRRMVLMK